MNGLLQKNNESMFDNSYANNTQDMTQFESGDNVDILGQNETINVDDDVIISFVYAFRGDSINFFIICYDWALSHKYLVKL